MSTGSVFDRYIGSNFLLNGDLLGIKCRMNIIHLCGWALDQREPHEMCVVVALFVVRANPKRVITKKSPRLLNKLHVY